MVKKVNKFGEKNKIMIEKGKEKSEKFGPKIGRDWKRGRVVFCVEKSKKRAAP